MPRVSQDADVPISTVARTEAGRLGSHYSPAPHGAGAGAAP